MRRVYWHIMAQQGIGRVREVTIEPEVERGSPRHDPYLRNIADQHRMNVTDRNGNFRASTNYQK
jgi:hypothetical protein